MAKFSINSRAFKDWSSGIRETQREFGIPETPLPKLLSKWRRIMSGKE